VRSTDPKISNNPNRKYRIDRIVLGTSKILFILYILFEFMSDFTELTTEPIDITSVARRVVPPECGATVTLDGYVRQFTKGRETLQLVYEAYEPMAVKEMQKLVEQVKMEFEVANVGIVHRLGRLEIGETSVVISVAAPHRRAAFAACEWLIKELKRTVPIWKKEVYADGEIWIEGDQSEPPA
jgi:molybdopterin synthase catalytic subunit